MTSESPAGRREDDEEPTGVFVPSWGDDAGDQIEAEAAPSPTANGPAWVPIPRESRVPVEEAPAPLPEDVGRPRLFDDETATTNPAALDEILGSPVDDDPEPAVDDAPAVAAIGNQPAVEAVDHQDVEEVDVEPMVAAVDDEDVDGDHEPSIEDHEPSDQDVEAVDVEPAVEAVTDSHENGEAEAPATVIVEDEPTLVAAGATDPGALRPGVPGSEAGVEQATTATAPVGRPVPSRGAVATDKLRAFVGLVLLIVVAGVGLAAAIGVAVGGLAFVLRQTVAG